MLSTPEPHESLHDRHNGPWILHRCDPGHPIVSNFSEHDAEFVRTSYRSHIDGQDHPMLWGTVGSNEEFNLCFCDEPETRAVRVTLSWFDPGSDVERSWTFLA